MRSIVVHRPFYGWAVVAAAFAVTFVGFGSAYTFSAFVEPLQREFDASRGSVSLVFSLAGFLYFGLGVVSGPLADRLGARRLAVLGMLLVGTGLALASTARTLGEVYVAYSLGVGLGLGCAYAPALGAVQRWFVKRRGFASGLAVSGVGVGTLVMPPLASWLIDALDWRQAYLVLGAAAAIIGAGMSLFLVNDPGDHGLGPDGDLADAARTTCARPGMSVSEAIRTRAFLGLYLACLICALGVFTPFVHLTSFALDHHVSPSLAVSLLSIIGVGSTVGRFFLGDLADRMGRRFFLLAVFVSMAASLTIWAFATGFWSLVVFALLFGVCYGGWVAILPAVLMDYFGGRNISAIIGLLYTSVAIGTLVGPSAAGFIFDFSRSYTWTILACVAANVIAAVVAAFATRPTT